MNTSLAESFFRNIYDTHVPNIGGDCSVCEDGSDMGYGIPYPCNYYESAAEILGLPIVEWVKPPRKPLTPEQEAMRMGIIPEAYRQLAEWSLRPNPFYDLSWASPLTGTVTFRVES